MPDWLEWVLGVAAIMLVAGVVMWPTERNGKRLLRTWGMGQPTDDQVSEAVIYLRQRRILFVALFFAQQPASGLLHLSDLRLPAFGIFGPLVVAMLVAELIAVWRPYGVMRGALLAPRSWRDLVPKWALGVAAVQVLLVVVFVVAVPARLSDRLGALAYAAGCLLLVGLLVHLAARRRTSADEAVAMTLRLRTARVAVGIGFGWLGAALLMVTRTDITSWGTTATYLQLFSVFAWIWIANGTQPVFARARR